MVGKVWSESLYPKIKQAEDFSTDQFYKSQWQNLSGVSLYFLVYRWITSVLILIYSIASIFEKDPLSRPSLTYPKYPIYFTNWVVWVTCVQALLSTGVVTYYFIRHRQKEGVEEDDVWIQRTIKVYWVTQTIAIVTSIAASVIFWVGVYDPEINPLNVFTFTSHGVLAAFLVVDALIVAHPFRLVDFLWVFMFAISYLAFSLIYYLLGGTDRYNRSFIYNILDWEEPKQPLITTFIVTFLCLFIHGVVWLLTYSVRFLVHDLKNKPAKSKVETVIDIIDTEAPALPTSAPPKN